MRGITGKVYLNGIQIPSIAIINDKGQLSVKVKDIRTFKVYAEDPQQKVENKK